MNLTIYKSFQTDFEFRPILYDLLLEILNCDFEELKVNTAITLNILRQSVLLELVFYFLKRLFILNLFVQVCDVLMLQLL